MAGKTAILSLKILGDAKDAQKALDSTSKSAGKFESSVSSAAVPATAALAGLAAAGLSAAQAAAEDQAAADQLALALRNSAGASEESIAQTEDWITQTSKAAAVADDELRPALATLVRATGDVEKSQEAMGVALDVSAATGQDVESVSKALAKAYGGQTAGLKKLVPGMDDAILKSGDMDAIMAELARTTGGAAAEAAGTAAGQMEGMKIAMGEAQEEIGAALLPALSKLAEMLSSVATWISENSRVILVLGGVLGGAALAVLGLNLAFKAYHATTKAIELATKAWAAAQKILNAVMRANPIGLIITAVLALVAAVVYLWNTNEDFRVAVTAIWDAILSVIKGVWDGIMAAGKAAIDFLLRIWNSIKGPITAVWNFVYTIIKTYLNLVKTYVRTVINIIVTIWNTIKGPIKAVWDWILGIIKGIIERIKTTVSNAMTAITSIWNRIKGPIKDVWEWIIEKIKGVLDRIKSAVTTTTDKIVAIWEGIQDAIGAVWDWLQDAAETALDAILTPVNAVKDAFDNVVGAIKSMITWLGNIKMPKVLDDIGDAIGNITPWSVAPPAASSTGGLTAPAAGTFAAPALSSGASSSGSGSLTIVVQGALDPVAVARQIRGILQADDRRRSGVVIGR